MRDAYDTDEFVMNGRTYCVEYCVDDDHGPPWEEYDGHGEVTEYTNRDKHPGERVLYTDGSWHRFYDVAASTRTARRDGWGLNADELAALTRKLGRTPTRGEIAARAVEMDFDYLRGWCNDDWHYIGVVVTDPESGLEESLWGVEDGDQDYVDAIERQLAGEIAAERDRAVQAVEAKRRADIMNITRTLVR